MSKRDTMQVALVYLLVVVLSLVNHSDQHPSFLMGKTKKNLLDKLNEESLTPDKVFEYLEEASKKGKMTIGGTSLKKLVQMNEINWAHCDEVSQFKRSEVYEKAMLLDNENINRYCHNRLEKLTKFCGEHAAKQADTVGFFRSLLEKHAFSDKMQDTGRQDDYATISAYLGDTRPITSDWQIRKSSDQGETPNKSVITHKIETLEEYCKILIDDFRDSEIINQPGGEAEDKFESVSDWFTAHNLCKFFLHNLGKYGVEGRPGDQWFKVRLSI